MKTMTMTNKATKRTVNWKTVIMTAETAIIVIVASIAFGFYLGVSHTNDENTKTQQKASQYAQQFAQERQVKQ